MIEDDDPLLSRLRALPPRKMDEAVAARVRLKARAIVVDRSNAPSSFFARRFPVSRRASCSEYSTARAFIFSAPTACACRVRRESS